jgi:hypothetical protein
VARARAERTYLAPRHSPWPHSIPPRRDPDPASRRSEPAQGEALRHRPVASLDQARAALEYFNAFHDGFIRRLALISHDVFEARGVHTLSGRLDLELDLAHYNYRDGEPPADQIVELRFTEVRDLWVDLPYANGEWAIVDLRVSSATRTGFGNEEQCLQATMRHHRLDEGQWTVCEVLRFTFKAAEFTEVP